MNPPVHPQDHGAAVIQPSAFQPLGSAEPKPPRKPNKLRWLLAACALGFTLVMLFLFSARSLQVVVTAQTPADVSIDGLALAFGNRFLLRPGNYTVRASADLQSDPRLVEQLLLEALQHPLLLPEPAPEVFFSGLTQNAAIITHTALSPENPER